MKMHLVVLVFMLFLFPVAIAQPEKEGQFYQNHNDTHQPSSPQLSLEGEELLGLASQCEYKIGDKFGPQSNLKKLGCFNDIQQPPRPLPVLLLDELNVTVDLPDAKDEWRNFLKGFVCKCAKEARKRNFYTFGIQNYAQCYSGPDEGRYAEDREAPEGMCINEDQEPCKTSDKQFCAGISKEEPHTKKPVHANFVYMIMTETHQQIKYIEYDRKKRNARKIKLGGRKKRNIRKIILGMHKKFLRHGHHQ